MWRLRIGFALLAAALLVPAALFARRALEAQADERAARHEVLAARVFDEMERALSDFVRREEARPIGHYGFSWVPEGSVAGLAGRARSPLSSVVDDAAAPFVVGWFQVDPDGSVHSPLVPRADEAPLGAPPGPEAPARAARVREIVAAAFPPPAARSAGREPRESGEREKIEDTRVAPRAESAELVEPTRPLAESTPPAPEAPKATAPPQPDAFAALRSLNRGAEAREARAPRVLVGPAAEAGREALASAPATPGTLDASTDAPQLALRATEDDASASSPSAQAREKGALAAREGWDEGGTEGPAPRTPAWERPAAPPSAAPAPPALRARRPPSRRAGAPARPGARRGDPVPVPAPPPARVVVDPFVGRRAASHLLLVRTVLLDGRGTRQGVVVDPARLAAWLRDAGVGAAALPPARLRFEPGGAFELGASPPATPAYRHAFAAPFETLAAELALAPLAEPPAERAARWLALLLPATGALGLLALYRMVVTRLAFARRRGEFVAAVSHELKTPLTAIRLVVELLRDGAVDSEEKRRAYYATLGAESERLSRLIDGVLELSRLERGPRETALEAGDLAEAVEELASMLGARAERAGAKLELVLAPGLPSVRFERDALAQVLFNLVDNACKYAGGRIELSLRPDGGRVVLAVRDGGPGVPAADLARIFEPFERGGRELTREAPGTGLGLALVRGLAERLGAGIAARNLPGGGFEVALVFAPAPGGPGLAARA